MFRFYIILIIFSCVCSACGTPASKYPVVLIQTKHGEIAVELYTDKAPQTAGAFLKNVDAGIYKNSYFYRVLNQDNQASDAVKTFLVQGGIWRNNSKLSDSLSRVPHETTQQTGILHTDGVISMARQEPGSAGTEFFLCIGNQPGLDFGGKNNPDGQGYAAFGKVIEGLDVLRKIYRQPEEDQYFFPPVPIYNITR
ncbi:peptidylprolyl isomerase [Aridibaculum aurantiacum]|uniref:peptidylprolyl isomerase n=1 Tax=Aridibaculum aurantiacum TaxID=2810307 RepID=UPI001A972E3C|nr:peptidylprolyl isomerase [Aridibaculum aurantiacum]